MPGVLDGIRVLDFSRGRNGAVTAMVLSDYGAEVIKVEPRAGDPFRKNPAWLMWNRGKKGVTIDLETEVGKQHALELAKRADVLIESFRPGAAEKLGIGYAALSKANPALIYTSITGWGQKGRLSQYKDYEPLVVAKIGRMKGLAGLVSAENRPTYAAAQVSAWGAESAAIRGILAALHVRETTGRGQWVQSSLIQGTFYHDFTGLLGRQLARKFPKAFKENAEQVEFEVPTNIGYFIGRTKDGQWLQMSNTTPRLQIAFLKAVGLGHLLEQDPFKGYPQKTTAEARAKLRDMLLEHMPSRTAAEWMAIFIRDGNIGAEPYGTVRVGMDHPQMVHNGNWAEVDDPQVGRMKQIGIYAELPATPGKVQGPAPKLGQDNAAVLGNLAKAPAPARSGARGPAPKHPLSGITIVDLSSIHAGPLSELLLADLGARVIHIDPMPEGVGGGDGGAGQLRLSGGKENMHLDLKTSEGQEVLHRLIAKADVVFHNMRPDVPARLKFDYETCKKLNSKIIHVSLNAYGVHGPYSHRPGNHPIPPAILGAGLLQAGPAMPPPADKPLTLEEMRQVYRWLLKANEGNVDQCGGFAAATAIMLALYARDRTGQGQAICIPLVSSFQFAMADDAYWYEGRPPLLKLDAGVHGVHALWRLYRTAQGGWVMLCINFGEEWEAFCKGVGRPELLTDPRFATEADRKASDQTLTDIVAQIFQGKTAPEWEGLLTGVDVGCVEASGAIIGKFLEEDQHSQDNGFAVEVEHAKFGKYLRHGSMVDLSETPAQYRPGTIPGQHTKPLLKEIGYTEAQTNALRDKKVIEWADVKPMPA